MPFNTTIPEALKPFYEKELEKYSIEYKRGNLRKAWHHLERAHIIGQKYPLEHTAVHWKMLLFGINTKNPKEIIGQIPRLFFSGIRSFSGNIAIGNPGGASVPSLKPFPIAHEIQEILSSAEIE